MEPHFELKISQDRKYFFNLKAGNGQVILSSQRYADRSGAERGIESVRHHACEDACFARKTSTRGEPYFVLVAHNGQAIGTSEMYSSPSAMENGVASVKRSAPQAGFRDLTAA